MEIHEVHNHINMYFSMLTQLTALTSNITDEN